MTDTGAHTSHSGTRQAKDELKQDAQTIKESVGKQAENQARMGRDEAVGAAKAAGSAIDKAADELRRDENAPDWLASMLTSVGGQIQRIAGEFENREPREMMRSVEDFGRRTPGMFLAASAAAGFAAGRYLRAGAAQHSEEGEQRGERRDNQRYERSGNVSGTGMTPTRMAGNTGTTGSTGYAGRGASPLGEDLGASPPEGGATTQKGRI